MQPTTLCQQLHVLSRQPMQRHFKNMPIMLFFQAQDYQPKCQQLFSSYKNQIIQLLPSALIEHIGASSIPSSLSKGDLDIYAENN